VTLPFFVRTWVLQLTIGADFMGFTLCPSAVEKAGFITFFRKIIQKIVRERSKIIVAELNLMKNGSKIICSIEGGDIIITINLLGHLQYHLSLATTTV
jgi:hypothetical protein